MKLLLALSQLALTIVVVGSLFASLDLHKRVLKLENGIGVAGLANAPPEPVKFIAYEGGTIEVVGLGEGNFTSGATFNPVTGVLALKRIFMPPDGVVSGASMLGSDSLLQ